MRHSRRASALIAALTLTGALGLAACGGDDSGSTAAPSATTATGSAAAGGSSTTGSAGSKDTMGAFGPACSQVPSSGAGSFSGMAEAPAATAASANPLLSTLVGAVKEADLVDTLNGPGPFTIFAPANDAFAKVDPAALKSAMADPSGALTQILTYHVVAGESLDAKGLSSAGTLDTVEGGTVKITGSGEDLKVNGANVLCGNVKTANATVYIIDSVLMPSAGGATASASGSGSNATMGAFGPACSAVPTSGAGSFAGMAQAPAATAASANPVLSTLVSAVSAAGLVDTLNGPGPFTIFAPANDAFTKLDPATLSSAMADPTGLLSKVLTYHVVAGQNLDATALLEAGSLKTVQGGSVTVTGSGEDIKVNGAKVICGNVKTANATVYIIDSVLMPTS